MSSSSGHGTISDKGTGEDVSATLYFGNLHPYVQQSSLEDLCTYFGPVEVVKVIKDKITGNSAGYGFVKFWDRSFAESALQALNGKMYLGQEMRVNWAFPDHHKEDTSQHFHIFVGDLGSEVTDSALHNAFCAHWQCSDARVMWDHNTGRSKGYGFVSFRTKEDAEKAIEKMQGMQIGSRRVRLGWAQHKQEENSSPRDLLGVDRCDPSNCNVYIGNISPDATELDLRTFFEGFGPIFEIKMHKKGGYGFVMYHMHESAVMAIAKGHGHEIHGKAMKCAWGRNTQSSQQSLSSSPATAPAFDLAAALQATHISQPNTYLNGLGQSLSKESLGDSSTMLPGNSLQPNGSLMSFPTMNPGSFSSISMGGAPNALLTNALGGGAQLMDPNGQNNAAFDQSCLTQMLATQMLMLQNLQTLQAQQDVLSLQAMNAYRRPVLSSGELSRDSGSMTMAGGTSGNTGMHHGGSPLSSMLQQFK
ncbi:hypothetical protein CEUSTIGMA_g108.t1 [Chlamydomonas eustigma]|uniref:RRM domain-containing protein n=1 Tax=Chlamydomonas eustigma TaxID=1157962 RepID=A0A250WPR6_9CHLO|nr:hypothetical protein CEUSTIGMA_g108.t1 [Chlamydomonas eustigma]|eukprot:GAX72652.1 hypothetical protein CEUSTIGMA_g108.t1 [Chlamydomonas eustigma]